MNSKYNNGKIYKIVDNTSDMVYVGSTCMNLEQRLKHHEVNYRRFKTGKYSFMTSFEILENNDYKIQLIKNYPCENKQELNLEEGKIIKELRNSGFNIINKYIAGQTLNEYYQNNKDKIKGYYKDNKDKIKEYVKEYKKNNKDKVKEYYKDNKDKLNQKNTCSCGGKYTHINKSIHERTRKHQEYINNRKTMINNGTINITININTFDDLEQLELDFLNAIKI
jgi:hypothetical protein